MIKNLILDMGGVILDVNYETIFTSFEAKGVKGLDTFFTQQKQLPIIDDFEVGKITPQEFRDGVRDLVKINLSDKDIDEVWNSMVFDPRKEDILMLQQLKDKYDGLYLFSNTNEIHVEYVKDLFMKTMGFDIFSTIFTKVYFSNEIHERKPNVSSFDCVVKDAGINKGESLFIDDTIQNIEGAKLSGLHALLLEKNKTLTDLMKEGVI